MSPSARKKRVYCLSISCNRQCYRHKHSEVTAQHSLLARYFIQRVERGHCVFEEEKTASHVSDRC